MMKVPRKTDKKLERTRFASFSELIGKSSNEIALNIYSGLYIDNVELFMENLDLFDSILLMNKYDTFYSKDYYCLKFIEDYLKDYTNITLALVDDFKNLDRSYIQMDYFKKTKFVIPFSYVLWNIDFKNNPNIACFCNKDNMLPYNTNGYNELSIENLKYINEIIFGLYSKYRTFSDEEKIILISNYLQNKVQFVAENNISKAIDGIYITDSKGINVTNAVVSNPENVLLNNFGVCSGIANATTMLLNNPEFNVNVRSVHGTGHVWNVAALNSCNYYIDNTWNITRNPSRYYESLKAKKFDSTYLLFGSESANNIGNHIPESYVPEIVKHDYNRKFVEEKAIRLRRVAKFYGYEQPVFESRLKRQY